MPKDQKQLHAIEGVEVFSVGVHNGDRYTDEDLNEMVEAFNENAKTMRPYLKLGHTEKQTLLQKDGLPAAGWIGKLYRKGEKLVADFIDIPEKIYQLLKRGAYRNVSAEIFWDINFNGKKYHRMLSGVALLGADTPALASLDDILALYGADWQSVKSYAGEGEASIIKSYTLGEQEEAEMTKEQIEKLEQEKAAAEAQAKQYQADLAAANQAKAEADAEVAQLRKYKAESEAATLAAEAAAESARLDATLTEMVSEKLITPSMKPYIRALLGEEKKEYSLQVKGAEDKDEEKKFTKPELLKSVLKLHKAAATVNFDESSEQGKQESSSSEEAQIKEIEKYAADHKLSFGDAARAYRAAAKSSAE
jgi:hypothetical protein